MVGGPGNPDTLAGARGGRLGLQEASHAEQFLDCVVAVRRIVGALTNQEAAGGPSQNGFVETPKKSAAWPVRYHRLGGGSGVGNPSRRRMRTMRLRN
jgi:hypothetical protein